MALEQPIESFIHELVQHEMVQLSMRRNQIFGRVFEMHSSDCGHDKDCISGIACCRACFVKGITWIPATSENWSTCSHSNRAVRSAVTAALCNCLSNKVVSPGNAHPVYKICIVLLTVSCQALFAFCCCISEWLYN